MTTQTFNRKSIKAFQRDLFYRKLTRLARLFGDMASKTLLASLGVVGMGAVFTGLALIQN